MSVKPHIVAGIFARGGSKGVPRKNIRLLAGKPLIAYAIEAAQAVPAIQRVFVSTDDAEIADVAKKHGAEIPFMRPAELAGDRSSEYQAWKHAVETLNTEPGATPVDIMVSVPPTSPLRSPVDVQACLDALLTSDADVAITVTPSARNPYFNMVTLDGDATAHIVLSAESRYITRQTAPAVYDITTVAYAIRTGFLLRSNSYFEGKVKAVVVPVERALDIDTELDFRMAEFLMKSTREMHSS